MTKPKPKKQSVEEWAREEAVSCWYLTSEWNSYDGYVRVIQKALLSAYKKGKKEAK